MPHLNTNKIGVYSIIHKLGDIRFPYEKELPVMKEVKRLNKPIVCV